MSESMFRQCIHGEILEQQFSILKPGNAALWNNSFKEIKSGNIKHLAGNIFIESITIIYKSFTLLVGSSNK